jgi:hypothetical protein
MNHFPRQFTKNARCLRRLKFIIIFMNSYQFTLFCDILFSPQSHFFQVYFNIFLLSMVTFSERSIPFSFFNQIFRRVCISDISVANYTNHSSQPIIYCYKKRESLSTVVYWRKNGRLLCMNNANIKLKRKIFLPKK